MSKTNPDSFKARGSLTVSGSEYTIYRLDALTKEGDIERLPYAIKILLENLLRNEDGTAVTAEDIAAVAGWQPDAPAAREIAFTPGRVILQDFTGVPSVVDLAAMRDAIVRLGGKAEAINPIQPAELVIDHSVQVDEFGNAKAFARNAELEFERNRERYAFLKWGQQAFDNFEVVPPDTGIVHQVNLEYLARVVALSSSDGDLVAFPDTLVGTDSHTTMINGLGVLGWGVGGIEAEAAMLGQPLSMLLPQVVGFELKGELAEGATATDLVLTVTQMLREKGVVGKFVEFFGLGLKGLPLADRATIANMAPEYGATCGIFPIDAETLRYLELTGRATEKLELIDAYAREQGLYYDDQSEPAVYSDTLALDLDRVEPSLAGPRRPQDRVTLRDAKQSIEQAIAELTGDHDTGTGNHQIARFAGEGGHTAVGVEKQAEIGIPLAGCEQPLRHGAVVIAAITSCTNTSNPSVMVAAGLLAKKAVELGLTVAPWVKTSLAPGSKVVSDYLIQSGLQLPLDQLGFNLVGYGCTTCIGNSGPLPPNVAVAVEAGNLVVASVLSGNRNFEGRINSEVKANYLASPPLVVAYALAGRVDIDLTIEPLGKDRDGNDVYLRDLWPSERAIDEIVTDAVRSEMFLDSYKDVFKGDEKWRALPVTGGEVFQWSDDSTYIKNPPYFEGMSLEPQPIEPIRGARVLALLGDSVTTDHISPAGAIKKDSPAGQYLIEHGVEPRDFNSYGSRRGNHQVMVRGTFANVRLRNRLLEDVEGGFTLHLPDGKQQTIYDVAMQYKNEGTALIVLAGKEYGSGSSRDWAAKGAKLLGVRAVIAESFERIHRSNLVGMGVLPLQFIEGENADTLSLSGRESYDISELNSGQAEQLVVTAADDGGSQVQFKVKVRIDTPQEVHYFQHGGILPFVLRRLTA